MKGLHGLANTDIHSAVTALEKQGLTVQVYAYPDKIHEDTDVVVICNTGVFNNLMDSLDSENVAVLVLDSAIRLDAYIGMTIWDVGKRKQSFRFEFVSPSFVKMAKTIKNELADEDSIVPCHSGINVAAELLNLTPNSYLSRLQTWKYKIKNTEVREEAFNAFVDWLFNPDQTKDQLLAYLNKLTGADKAATILFDTDIFEKIKVVLLDVKAKRDADKTVSMSKVAEKAELSTFDLQYLWTSYSKRHTVESDVALEDLFHRNKKKSAEQLALAEQAEKEDNDEN